MLFRSQQDTQGHADPHKRLQFNQRVSCQQLRVSARLSFIPISGRRLRTRASRTSRCTQERQQIIQVHADPDHQRHRKPRALRGHSELPCTPAATRRQAGYGIDKLDHACQPQKVAKPAAEAAIPSTRDYNRRYLTGGGVWKRDLFGTTNAAAVSLVSVL